MMAFNQTRPHPEWRIVVEYLKDVPYDSEWSHEQLAEMMAVAVRSHRYYGQMVRVRKHLREYQRELEIVRDKGYRIIRPSEHHAASRRQMVLGVRRQRTAIAIAQATPVQMLTPEEGAKLANHLAKIGSLVSQAQKVLQQTRLGLNPTPKQDVPKLVS